MVVYHSQDKLAEPSARTRLFLHVGWGEAFLRRELTNLLDMFCGNAVPVLENTLEISYVFGRVSKLFLNLYPLRFNTVLNQVDCREDILDASRWIGKCLNLLNVRLFDIRRGNA